MFHRKNCLHAFRLLVVCLLLLVAIGACAGGTPQASPEMQTVAAQGSNPTPTITLAFLGDVMVGRGVHPSSSTFAYLAPYLQSADLALANLESPLTNTTPPTTSPYSLCAEPGNTDYLADAGFDLFSLANNHHLDCGTEGLAETQSVLVGAGLDFIGPGADPVFRKEGGLQLAFLAFDATGDFDQENAASAVRSARDTGAIVLISIHWGAEYQSGASSEQKQIASRLAICFCSEEAPD